MDISVVIPVYNEAAALPELYRALAGTLDRLPQAAEIIFADDGSTDGSAAALDAIAEGDARVRVLHLSRNYGQTAALMAAIQNSTGDVIIPMDGDGQNDPADIPRLMTKLGEGYDLVSGWRMSRQDGALTRRLPSVVANRLISALLRVPLHDYGCTLKAYRREVLEEVRLYGEMHRFIPIYAVWEGARVTELAVSHSKYEIGRVARVLLDLLRPRPADPVFRQARPRFPGRRGRHLRLGGGPQIRLGCHLDPDAAAVARRDDRSLGCALSVARDYRRGAGAHLFRGARAAALQDQAGGGAADTGAASGGVRPMVVPGAAAEPPAAVTCGRSASLPPRRSAVRLAADGARGQTRRSVVDPGLRP
jgi:hypothetical protein